MADRGDRHLDQRPDRLANRYAEALVLRGFAALSFDFIGSGESQGQPRDGSR